MTTPNIEELRELATIVYSGCCTAKAVDEYRELTNPAKVIELLDALQSQAEQIKELSLQVVSAFGQAQEALEDRDTARAQLAALQVDDELPELGQHDHPEPRTMMWSDVEMSAIKAYARQAQAMVRAKMVPLEKDAARYRWLRDSEWEMFRDSWLCECHIYGEGSDQLDAAIDAAMGITGEPK